MKTSVIKCHLDRIYLNRKCTFMSQLSFIARLYEPDDLRSEHIATAIDTTRSSIRPLASYEQCFSLCICYINKLQKKQTRFIFIYKI